MKGFSIKLAVFFVMLLIFYLLFSILAVSIDEILTVKPDDLMNSTIQNLNKFKDKDYVFSIVFDINTYKLEYTAFKLLGYLAAVSLSFFAFSIFKFKLDSKYADSKYASHGTSRWMYKKEIKKEFYEDDVGWFLGDIKEDTFILGKKYAVHPVAGQNNMQINMIGAPGVKKTTGFILPNAFHVPYYYLMKTLKMNGYKDKIDFYDKNFDFQKVKKYIDYNEMPDMIFTDPKSEIFCITFDFFKKIGYDVWVLDYIFLKYGDSLNCLEYIDEEKEIIEVSSGLIATLRSTDGSQINANPIWEKGAAQILAFCISYCIDISSKHQRNMTKVIEILESEELSHPDDSLTFHETHSMSDISKKIYKKWLKVQGSLREGILGGLAIDLTLFAFNSVQNITNKSTIDLRELGAERDRPVALFLLISDSDNTFRPLVNTTTNTLFNTLYKTAYKYNNKLFRPVYTPFDEMYSVGAIPNIKKKLSTMRGRRIYPFMIWQDVNQANEVYSSSKTKGFDIIQGMCDVFISLGVNDIESAQVVSKRIGTKTIKVQNSSVNPNNSEVDKVSYNYIERELLKPDEVYRFDNAKSIIAERGKFPIQLNKVQYKYWEEDKRICDIVNLDVLPLLEDLSREISTKKPDIKTSVNPLPELNLGNDIKEQVLKKEIKINVKEDVDEEFKEEIEQEVNDINDELKVEQEAVVNWFDELPK